MEAHFENGLSLSQIIKQPDVDVLSTSQISKRSRKYGWEKSITKELLEKEVNAKLILGQVKKEKKGMTQVKKRVFNEAVNRIVHLTEFFDNSAIDCQEIANKLLSDLAAKEGDGRVSMKEIDQFSSLTSRNKTTVLGKEKEADKSSDVASFVIRTASNRD